MTAAQVDELAAVLPAVWNLMGDYARYVDGREAVAWSRLFGESGVLAVGKREITGPAALEEFGAQSAAGVHVQGIPTVERRPDGSIRATSSFVFVNATTHALVAGEYRDDIVDSGDGLVFARRQIEMRVRS
jgi:hypothetical protein